MYLNEAREQDATPDTTDKQPDADEDMPILNVLSTTAENRNERSTNNEQLNALRNTSVPSSSPTTRSRIDDGEVARHSIPETEVWEPYGTNEALRRLAGNQRPAASNIYTEAVSPASMEADRLEVQELDEEDAWYEEESLSYMGCDPTSLRVCSDAHASINFCGNWL